MNSFLIFAQWFLLGNEWHYQNIVSPNDCASTQTPIFVETDKQKSYFILFKVHEVDVWPPKRTLTWPLALISFSSCHMLPTIHRKTRTSCNRIGSPCLNSLPDKSWSVGVWILIWLHVITQMNTTWQVMLATNFIRGIRRNLSVLREGGSNNIPEMEKSMKE